jgi:YcxB-like protein
VTVRYELTESEFLDAQHALLGRRLRSRLVVVCVAMMLVAGGLYLYGRRLTVVVVLVLLPITFGFLWLFLVWSWRRTFRAIPSAQRQQSVDYSPDGLVFESEMAHGRVRWGAYSHYVETDRLILLHQPSRVIVPLPKRAFAPDELGRFKQLLVERLPRDRPVRVKTKPA